MNLTESVSDCCWPVVNLFKYISDHRAIVRQNDCILILIIGLLSLIILKMYDVCYLKDAALRSMGKVPQTVLSPKLKHKPK